MSTKNIKKTWMPEGEIAAGILNARRKVLSELGVEEEKKDASHYYVHFTLGRESYGIPFQYIQEVIIDPGSTRVPNTKPSIAGIINRHGSLLTIVDLRVFFNIQSIDATQNAYLIIVKALGLTLAILADGIEGSKSYELASLEQALSIGDAIKSKYILGLHHGTTAILNVEALMSNLQHDRLPFQGGK